MKPLWVWMFIVSSAGLIFVLMRGRIRWQWLGAAALNVIIGGLLLYLIGLAEPYTGFHVPVNSATLVTAAVLGVPGLAAIIGLQLLVV